MKVLKCCSVSAFCSLCQLYAALAPLLLVPPQHALCQVHLQHTGTPALNRLTDFFRQRCTHTCSNEKRDKLVHNSKAIVMTLLCLVLLSSLTPGCQFRWQQLVVRCTNERLIHFCCQGQLVVMVTGITG